MEGKQSFQGDALDLASKMDENTVTIKSLILSQVHDRSVTHSKQSGLTEHRYTHWTSSELKASHQEQEDQVSLFSLPSLTSSGISSVQTNLEESCITPVESITRKPKSAIIKQPITYERSVSEKTDFQSASLEEGLLHTKSDASTHQTSPNLSSIVKPCEDNIDWNSWFPTKFQCNFCQKRFLLDSQLQTHLRTHKRYQRQLRHEGKHKALDTGNLPLPSSNDDLPQRSLACRPHLNSSGTPEASSPSFSTSQNKSHGHPVSPQNPSSASEGSSLSRLEIADDQHTKYTNIQLARGTMCSGNTASSGECPGKIELNVKSNPDPPYPSTTPGHLLWYSGAQSERLEAGRISLGVGNCQNIRRLGDGDNTGFFDLQIDVAYHGLDTKGAPMIDTLPALVKQRLMNRIMDEFMTVLKQGGASHLRKYASASKQTTSTAPSSESGTSSIPYKNSTSRQRGRKAKDDDVLSDGDDSEEDQRAPKRPRTSTSLGESQSDISKYACPYRKHNPRKYGVRKWRPCALTPLDSIARVKAHLYRHHRIFQCQRCKAPYSNQLVLDEHISALQSCEFNAVNLAEGVTADIERKLRSRKKAHSSQTGPERWNEVYHTLFPTAILLPSPFFEPVEENVEPSVDSQRLADFEEYTRSELPRMFWAALEEVVSNEMKLVEERLRSQLMGVIQNCQGRVISTYESMLNTNLDTLITDSARGKLSTMFQPLSRPTFSQEELPSILRLPIVDDTATTVESNNGTSESGYACNFSAVNSSTTLSSIFNSSTTLSSIFNSSTTLSSIASSAVAPLVKESISEGTDEIDERHLDITNEENTLVTHATVIPSDFWTSDLVQTDLSQFDMDGIWDIGIELQEVFQ